jgi:AhpC/TSA antioxidant enzyme
VFCKQQVAQLRDMEPAIRARGADLVVVGNGSLDAARAFRESEQVGFTLLTDPSRRTYDAAGLKHGLATVMSPKVLLRGVRAAREGHHQTATQGDPLQQGGAFVIAPGDRDLFAFVSQTAGEHPDLAQVVAALP